MIKPAILDTEHGPTPAPKRRFVILAICVLAVLVLVTYSHAPSMPFSWDDFYLVDKGWDYAAQNAETPLSSHGVWDYFSVLSGRDVYRPGHIVTLLAQNTLAGDSGPAHHWIGVGLLLLTVLTLWWAMQRLWGCGLFGATAAAAIFAVNPFSPGHQVCVVSALFHLWSVLFFLGSLLAFEGWRRDGRPVHLFIAAAALLAALLTGEYGYVLGAICVAHLWLNWKDGDKGKLRRGLIAFGVVLLIVALRFVLRYSAGAPKLIYDLTLDPETLLRTIAAIVKHTLFPFESRWELVHLYLLWALFVLGPMLIGVSRSSNRQRLVQFVWLGAAAIPIIIFHFEIRYLYFTTLPLLPFVARGYGAVYENVGKRSRAVQGVCIAGAALTVILVVFYLKDYHRRQFGENGEYTRWGMKWVARQWPISKQFMAPSMREYYRDTRRNFGMEPDPQLPAGSPGN